MEGRRFCTKDQQTNGADRLDLEENIVVVRLKSEHNFHFSIPLEVQRGFSPELQDLVGHTGQNPMEHEW